MPLLRVNRFGRPLGNVANAVKLGGLAACPHGVQALALKHTGLRHHGITAAHAGKAGSLGERTQLNGALLGALNLINGMGHIVLYNKGFIGTVKDDQSVIGQRIVYPLFQLRFGGAHTGGVVGKAQVDHIRSLLRQIGHKAVLLCAGHIDKVAVKAVGVLVTAAAVHGVGVHIHRVHRVTHSDLVVYAEQVADIAAVGLGAVGQKNLVFLNIDPAGSVIVLLNGVQDKFVTVLRRIAAESGLVGHLIHRLVHGVDHTGHQRTGHIADGQTDNICLRVRLLVLPLLSGYR